MRQEKKRKIHVIHEQTIEHEQEQQITRDEPEEQVKEERKEEQKTIDFIEGEEQITINIDKNERDMQVQR